MLRSGRDDTSLATAPDGVPALWMEMVPERCFEECRGDDQNGTRKWNLPRFSSELRRITQECRENQKLAERVGLDATRCSGRRHRRQAGDREELPGSQHKGWLVTPARDCPYDCPRRGLSPRNW